MIFIVSVVLFITDVMFHVTNVLDQKRKQQKFVSSLISRLCFLFFPSSLSVLVLISPGFSSFVSSRSSSPLTFSFLSCCDDRPEAVGRSVGRPPRHPDPADIFTRCSSLRKHRCSLCEVLRKHGRRQIRKYHFSPRQFPSAEFSSNVPASLASHHPEKAAERKRLFWDD